MWSLATPRQRFTQEMAIRQALRAVVYMHAARHVRDQGRARETIQQYVRWARAEWRTARRIEHRLNAVVFHGEEQS